MYCTLTDITDIEIAFSEKVENVKISPITFKYILRIETWGNRTRSRMDRRFTETFGAL